MQESIISTETIRTIQIFYYSSSNHIYINTVLIQLLNNKYVPENIKIKKTQIPEPSHHNFGQAPFICINHSQIIKRQQLWDFVALLLNIDPSRKYEFLSVAYLTEEISEVANIFSDYDQNPYFLLISPWRKYKRHYNLQNRKHWFRDNSLYCSSVDDSLNKEYFIYKVNSLGALITEYQKEYATKPEYLRYYKILTYALIKHLKIAENTMYLVMSEVKSLKQVETQIQQNLRKQQAQPADDAGQQRVPMRNIPFTNVHLNYLNENLNEKDRQDQQNQDYPNEKQKIHQALFKPLITTAMFVLAMIAFK